MAITINKNHDFENRYANNLETDFVDDVNQETKNNQRNNTGNTEWNPEFTNLLIDATLLIFTLLFAQ